MSGLSSGCYQVRYHFRHEPIRDPPVATDASVHLGKVEQMPVKHLHDDLVRLHKSMTPKERLELAFELSRAAGRLAAAGERARHGIRP